MRMHVCGLSVLDPSTMEGDPYECIRSMLLKAPPEVSLMAPSPGTSQPSRR